MSNEEITYAAQEISDLYANWLAAKTHRDDEELVAAMREVFARVAADVATDKRFSPATVEG